MRLARWYRVQPAFAQWLAACHTLHRQPAAAQVAVYLDGFHGVFRTTRVKAAVLAQQRADETLVATQQQEDGGRHGFIGKAG